MMPSERLPKLPHADDRQQKVVDKAVRDSREALADGGGAEYAPRYESWPTCSCPQHCDQDVAPAR